MARIRSIHPGLFSDPEFASLSDAAQIFYLGLLTEADDNGIFEWNAAKLRIRLRPGKDGTTEPLLSELERADKVRSYEVDGRKLGAIRNFRRYQRPKFPKSWHFMPDDFRSYVGLTDAVSPDGGNEPPSTPHPTPKPSQREEGGGRRKDGDVTTDGTEATGPRASALTNGAHHERIETGKGTRLPDDWRPDENLIAFAEQLGLNGQDIAAEFCDYWHGVPGARGRKLDWPATFRNRCREKAGHTAARPQRVRAARQDSELAAFARGAARVGRDEPV